MADNLTVEFTLEGGAYAPKKGTRGSSGWDISYSGARVVIPCGAHAQLDTGVAVSIPEGFEGQLRPRSSLSKRGLIVHLGTIDSDYRGPIKVLATNLSDDAWVIGPGDRIAQLVIAPVPVVEFRHVDALDDTERGQGGFGSTGR